MFLFDEQNAKNEGDKHERISNLLLNPLRFEQIPDEYHRDVSAEHSISDEYHRTSLIRRLETEQAECVCINNE